MTCVPLRPLSLLLLAAPLPAATPPTDLCERYDVLHYRLEVRVEPEAQHIEGRVTLRARVGDEPLERFQLELLPDLEVRGVRLGEAELSVEREGVHLVCHLPEPASPGRELELRIRYAGEPREQDRFSGFHWERTPSGAPWITTSCQGPGAHSWWPCKSSFFHPEDKPDEGVDVWITAPAGLTAVSNGRLEERVDGMPTWAPPLEGDWTTFRWHHPYPLETYSVTLDVAPYVHHARELELPGLEAPVPFEYWVLPENAEKAAVQFAQVPELMRIYSEAFGPWPFPEAKIGYVETSFWGMEHSSAVAYGSSYPAWCAQHGEQDPYARRNRWYDYILVHESAHEWWGNAVSAEHWGHFWVHEGLGTYAEGVFVERTQGREAAERWFAENARRIPDRGALYRGDRPTSGEAYSGLVYSKGAAVLHLLRHAVGDDEAWWRTLRAFQAEFRYGNATTGDFRAVLERETEREWKTFFDDWFYGEGVPRLEGHVAADEDSIEISLRVGQRPFHVPFEVRWREGEKVRSKRLVLAPGGNGLRVPCAAPPRDLELPTLPIIPGRHSVRVR